MAVNVTITTAPAPEMPIASVELQEYLFAQTLAAVAQRESSDAQAANVIAGDSKKETDWRNLRSQIRVSFRLQRFAVMNWLLMNGVSIPAALLSDGAHPAVGMQYPDKTVSR